MCFPRMYILNVYCTLFFPFFFTRLLDKQQRALEFLRFTTEQFWFLLYADLRFPVDARTLLSNADAQSVEKLLLQQPVLPRVLHDNAQ